MTIFPRGTPALRTALICAATTLLGCFSSASGVTLVYAGTATLAMDQGAAPTIGSSTVRLTECRLRSEDDYQAFTTFARLSIGDSCTFSGEWGQSTFLVDRPRQTCALSLGGSTVRVRVTDVMATRTMLSHHAGNVSWTGPDISALSVRMGAKVLEAVPDSGEAHRRVLFELSAPLRSVSDSLSWCESVATTRGHP